MRVSGRRVSEDAPENAPNPCRLPLPFGSQARKPQSVAFLPPRHGSPQFAGRRWRSLFGVHPGEGTRSGRSGRRGEACTSPGSAVREAPHSPPCPFRGVAGEGTGSVPGSKAREILTPLPLNLRAAGCRGASLFGVHQGEGTRVGGSGHPGNRSPPQEKNLALAVLQTVVRDRSGPQGLQGSKPPPHLAGRRWPWRFALRGAPRRGPQLG